MSVCKPLHPSHTPLGRTGHLKHFLLLGSIQNERNQLGVDLMSLFGSGQEPSLVWRQQDGAECRAGRSQGGTIHGPLQVCAAPRRAVEVATDWCWLFSSCMLNLYEETFNFSAFQSLQCLELLCVDCSFQASPVMSPHKNICGKDWQIHFPTNLFGFAGIKLSVNATSNSFFLSATMLSVAALLIPIFVTCMCSHIKDHSSQALHPKKYQFSFWLCLFLLIMAILLTARDPGVVASLLLCLGMLSASVESLAREIPSLSMKELKIQLINHTANAFCGSKVLVILLKANTFREKACLLDLGSSLPLPRCSQGFPEGFSFSFSLAQMSRMKMTKSGGKGRLGRGEAGVGCLQLIKKHSENNLTHKLKPKERTHSRKII